jgi:ribose transport system ATP-binding protein
MVRFGLLEARDDRAAQKIPDDMGFYPPAHAMLGGLTIGQQQLVATARVAAWHRSSLR